MKNIEIERKFLVLNEDYKQVATSHYTILQGYICKEPGRTVRVRIKTLSDGAQTAYLTIKSKPNANGFSRFEWEKEITIAEAEELLLLCGDAQIEKRRYLVKCGKHTYEVDEFYGDNQGLVVAEIELDDEDETFEKPLFLGEEVTGDEKYYNSHLTRFPYKYWKSE
jgi:CYTH domain-containing protein